MSNNQNPDLAFACRYCFTKKFHTAVDRDNHERQCLNSWKEYSQRELRPFPVEGGLPTGRYKVVEHYYPTNQPTGTTRLVHEGSRFQNGFHHASVDQRYGTLSGSGQGGNIGGGGNNSNNNVPASSQGGCMRCRNLGFMCIQQNFACNRCWRDAAACSFETSSGR